MIQTRAFAANDAEAFLRLYRECLEHHGIAPATFEQERRALALLTSDRHMTCLMAFDGVQPVGFATWTLTLPAGAGLAVYMKELFVSHSVRGKGVGRALISALVSIAEAENCMRIDWQTDGDNQMAQRFYKSIGAPSQDKKSFRVLSRDFGTFRARMQV